MKVHVLVLNYNGARLLERYLPSLVEAAGRSKHPCRLSVVDNASSDDSRSVALKFGAGWIAMPVNRVLCSYNDAAAALDDDILIFMNNDIAVDENFIDPLVGPFVNNDDVFMVTMRCLSLSTRQYEGNRTRARIRFGVFWSSAVYPGHEASIGQPGLTFQGGFGAFDRKKFLMLDGYDDLYLPGRLEDADICFRAYKRGLKCLYEPSSVVYHEGGVSFHKAFGARRTLVINWRNTFLFMAKNLSDPLLWLQCLFWLPLRLIYSILSFKPELAVGFFQALPRVPEAVKRRRTLAGRGFLSAVPDRVIFGRV